MMSVVNLACPHCNGLLEIDESLSGRQVSCPNCMGVVTIPSLSDLYASPAPPPPPPMPGPFSSSPPSFLPSPPMDFGQHPASHHDPEVFQLHCPLCANPFSVTPEMQGQEAHCPTCNGVVTIPMLGAHDEPPPMYESPSLAPPPPMDFGPHASVVPVGSVPMGNVPSPAAPGFPQLPTFDPAPGLGGFPGGNPIIPAGGIPNFGTPSPPNMPGFPPAGQTPAMPQPLGGNMPIPLNQRAGNMPIPLAPTHSQSAAPAPLKKRLSSEPAVLIPTEDGGHVAVHAPVKTIKKGRQEIELRRLTPEEKAKRRRTMNLLVMAFGMIFLSIVFFVLIKK